MVRAVGTLALLSILLSLSACRGRPRLTVVQAEGYVFIEGRPVNNVQVRFIPKQEGAGDYVAYGISDETGHFSLTCHNKPGAAVGENLVVILEGPIPPGLSGHGDMREFSDYFKRLGDRPSADYAHASTTPLTVTVTPEQSRYDFQLSR